MVARAAGLAAAARCSMVTTAAPVVRAADIGGKAQSVRHGAPQLPAQQADEVSVGASGIAGASALASIKANTNNRRIIEVNGRGARQFRNRLFPGWQERRTDRQEMSGASVGWRD